MSLTLSHQVERIAQQQNPNNPSTPESLIAIILVITMTNIHITLFIMCWYFGNCKKTKNEAEMVRALYDYVAASDEEISFKEGNKN